jgi:hypothetical protein
MTLSVELPDHISVADMARIIGCSTMTVRRLHQNDAAFPRLFKVGDAPNSPWRGSREGFFAWLGHRKALAGQRSLAASATTPEPVAA